MLFHSREDTVLMAFMSWWELAAWGFIGGFVAEGLPLWRMVQQNNGVWLPRYRTRDFFIAETIRLLIGAILAVALGESGQVTGAIGALGVGIAAPAIIDKLSEQLPGISISHREDNG
jgi:hypothetical protein